MKKTIFTLLFVFMGIGIIKADGFNYEFNWKNDNISIKGVESIAKTKDGYLAGGFVNDTNSYVVKLDNTGKELAHAYLDGEHVIDVYEYGTYYYAIEEDHWQIVLYKLRKSDLSIEGKTITPAEISGDDFIIEHKNNIVMITSIGYDYPLSIFNNSENKLELFAKFDLNSGSTDFVSFTENPNDYSSFNSNFSKEYQLFLKEKARNRDASKVATNGKNNVVVGAIDLPNGSSKGYIAIYDKDNNFIKEYVSNSAGLYGEVLIKNGYILVTGYEYSKIDIIDMSGKYIKSIDLVKEYDGNNRAIANLLIDTANGFSVSYSLCDNNALRGMSIGCIASLKNYELLYNINMKTDGNGDIVLEKNTEFGNEEVRFIVKPKEGYQLKEVRVTDVNGEVIVFKNYTFTMPYSDVLIEAVFVLGATVEQKNPETLSGAVIFGSLIVLFLAMSIGIYSFRKAKGLM